MGSLVIIVEIELWVNSEGMEIKLAQIELCFDFISKL